MNDRAVREPAEDRELERMARARRLEEERRRDVRAHAARRGPRGGGGEVARKGLVGMVESELGDFGPNGPVPEGRMREWIR